jgi:flagellar biosynthesis/type III secretory pathway ATPase
VSARREAEELRSLGAYTPGSYPLYDEALAFGERFDRWARQKSSERSEYPQTLATLGATLESGGGRR